MLIVVNAYIAINYDKKVLEYWAQGSGTVFTLHFLCDLRMSAIGWVPGKPFQPCLTQHSNFFGWLLVTYTENEVL
jgi:hypothetical protein